MPIRITGMNSGLDTESIINQLVSAQSAKKDSYTKAQTKLSWKQDAWKTLNSKVYSLYTGTISNLRFSSAYKQKKTTLSDSSIASVTTSGDAVDGIQTLKVKQLAKSGYLTGAKVDDSITSSSSMGELLGLGEGESADFKVGDETITVNKDTKVSDVIEQMKSKGVNANFDETNKRIFVSAKSTGSDADFKITADNDNGLKALSKLGLLTEDADTNATVDENGKKTVSSEFAQKLESLGLTLSTQKETGAATRIYGQKAMIELNGAEFESESNSFSINGLNITANKVSDQEVSLTTRDDYDGIYDTIKGFLKKYNELVNEFDKLYNADSSKGYEPLTSDEKYAMSDKEVEDWEKKIKDSLFRRDATLGDFRDSLHSAMTGAVDVSGTMMYLSDFGINTLGYFESDANEKHAFHIDGDQDDSNTMANTDKLKAMIQSDPEKTVEFFQTLANNLYKTITDKTAGSTNRTKYKIYDDKLMEEDYKNYTKKIEEEQKKLTALEDKWYSKFGAMETALAKLSSKTSAISGLLGM